MRGKPTNYNSDDTPGQNGEPALDTLFRSLAHSRRRYILESLQAHESPLALADVADKVATKEQEMPSPRSTPKG